MKKLLLLLIVLFVSIQSFAELKPKHVAGKWKYEIVLMNSIQPGEIKFVKYKGKLTGEMIQSGETNASTLSNIEIKKKNKLFFELPRENDETIEFVVTINKKEFKGKGWINEASFVITGEKQKE